MKILMRLIIVDHSVILYGTYIFQKIPKFFVLFCLLIIIMTGKPIHATTKEKKWYCW